MDKLRELQMVINLIRFKKDVLSNESDPKIRREHLKFIDNAECIAAIMSKGVSSFMTTLLLQECKRITGRSGSDVNLEVGAIAQTKLSLYGFLAGLRIYLKKYSDEELYITYDQLQYS